MKKLSIVSTLALFIGCNVMASEVINSGIEDRSSLLLMIYNQDMALINDTRKVTLPKGLSRLNLQGVSPQMQPASAVLHSQKGVLQLQAQHFKAVTRASDLRALTVGQNVTLLGENSVTGAPTRERAKIISISGGLIFEIDGHYETDLAGRRITYDALPEGVLSPTLSADIMSKAQFKETLTLSYLSQGLSWQADYIARLNKAGDTLQLRAMASINNHSGIGFKQAKVDLIAGTVNQSQAPQPMRKQLMRGMAMMEGAPSVQSQVMSDFHRYPLPRPLDLAENSLQQVMLFEAKDIPVKRRYQLAGQAYLYHSPNPSKQTLNVNSFLEFENKAVQNLGLPMPAGTVRVYAQDSASTALQFLGADQISHTPALAKLSLKMGQVFDLSAIKQQRVFRQLPVQQPYRQHSEAEIETVLHNAKDEAVVVEVVENFSGEWSVVEGAKPTDARTRSATWAVTVPAKGKAVLRLKIRVKN